MVKEPSASEEAQTYDDYFKQEDFKDFLRILAITEGVPDKLTEVEKEKIVDKYQIWVSQDRPKPSLPKGVQSGVEEILRIYRRKWKGKQYISYLVKGQSEQIGMKTDIVYGKNQDQEEDKSIIISRDRYPTIEYSEKEARKILAKAKRYNSEVKLYFVFQTMTIAIQNEENFFGEFDKLVEKAMKKEII